ncbi:MAG: TPM domain-containing protein [Calditrichales bacterium]|nr:MAG: TPM domain-containing protein [Calditrichales bacterium]
MNIEKFFSKSDKARIVEAIRDAEKQTSGEIRVHLESTCKTDTLERAVKVFEKLKMHETQLHNGTLIYLAVKDKKFAIFGDKGINETVPENFWQDVRDCMRGEFNQGKFAEGLIAGIGMVGQKLKEIFPYQDDDINELTDDLSIGK